MKIEQSVIDSIRSRPRFKIYTDKSSEDYALYLKKISCGKCRQFFGKY